MSEETVSPKNVSDLIDYLMKAKDPAVVGLRRILKKKPIRAGISPFRNRPWRN